MTNLWIIFIFLGIFASCKSEVELKMNSSKNHNESQEEEIVELVELTTCSGNTLNSSTPTGDGSSESPYIICSAIQLRALGTMAIYNDSNINIRMEDDIELSSESSNIIGDCFDSTCDASEAFTGNFDGNGFSISNYSFSASTKDYAGIFGYLGTGGEISNLTVEAGSFTAQNNSAILVGFSEGILTNITIKQNGNFTAGNRSGTLVGSSSGTITGSKVELNGDFTGGDSTGVVVGYNEGLISDSGVKINGLVSGITILGGFVGENHNNISRSFVELNGSVSSENYAGGFVGFSYNGDLTDNYAKITTSGTNSVEATVGSGFAGSAGGFAGRLEHYAGTVDATRHANISRNYAMTTGDISGASDGGFSGSSGYSGGNNEPSWDKNYWQNNNVTTTDDKACSPQAVGEIYATDETNMKQELTYTGWDFINDWEMGEDGYPQLR